MSYNGLPCMRLSQLSSFSVNGLVFLPVPGDFIWQWPEFWGWLSLVHSFLSTSTLFSLFFRPISFTGPLSAEKISWISITIYQFLLLYVVISFVDCYHLHGFEIWILGMPPFDAEAPLQSVPSFV